MKKLKILVSAYACNPMSSAQLHPGEDIAGWKIVHQLSRFHELLVITHSYNRKGIDSARSRPDFPPAEYHFVHLPSILRGLYKVGFGQRVYYYLWQIKAWREARKLHDKIRFDMAHHVTFGNDWIPTFIGAFLPVPFIAGPVGGGQKTPGGLWREYSLYGKFAEISRSAAQWIGRNDRIRKKGFERAKAILVCNKETKETIGSENGSKVFFFPVNGISREDLDMIDSYGGSCSMGKYAERERFRVITAGRFHRLKGFSLAIRAFKLLSEKFPDSELILVGEGPEEARLSGLIAVLDLKTKIRILPWLSRSELFKEICSSHVMLFPSFRDGGGAVVVEAMACGKPVICLDVGGPGFHIRKEWGIKIEPRSPEYVVDEMAKALELLYLNKELREKMGNAARERAESFYLWDRLGERMQEIYQKVLDRDSNLP